ncbi:hypothetical protein [Frigoribacterium faeni]|nr:hypothetical protein [Frigoribacterium faeni]MBA8813083.1 hypothetical protein [Frigoribacterium faeni]
MSSPREARGPRIERGDPDLTRASLDLALPPAMLAGLVRRAVQTSPSFTVTTIDDAGAVLSRRSALATGDLAFRLTFTPVDGGTRIDGELRPPSGTIGASVKRRDDDATALFEAIASAAGPF